MRDFRLAPPVNGTAPGKTNLAEKRMEAPFTVLAAGPYFGGFATTPYRVVVAYWARRDEFSVHYQNRDGHLDSGYYCDSFELALSRWVQIVSQKVSANEPIAVDPTSAPEREGRFAVVCSHRAVYLLVDQTRRDALYLAERLPDGGVARAEPVESWEAAKRALRDIFGNPLHPVSFSPEWRTESVVALARGIYEERAWDRMTVLADALEDAGCSDEAVLAHCREPALHVRGCWMIDSVLGKT